MKFLADESCDSIIVRSLRGAGYDVVSISEISPGIGDLSVIDKAIRERRILLTEDKDFGQLVFANQASSGGVIFLRFPAQARTTIAKTTVDFINHHKEEIMGCFVVLQPGRIRITKI